jgi:hypothetical protein
MKKDFKCKNDTVFFRDDHEKSYTVISNSLIQDEKLNFLERMIIIYLLSKPKDWIVNKNQVIKESGFGIHKVDKAWSNLIKFGYINQIRIQRGWSYEIIEKPQLFTHQNLQVKKFTGVKNEGLQSKDIIQSTDSIQKEVPEFNKEVNGSFIDEKDGRAAFSSTKKSGWYNQQSKEYPEMILNNDFGKEIDEESFSIPLTLTEGEIY